MRKLRFSLIMIAALVASSAAGRGNAGKVAGVGDNWNVGVSVGTTTPLKGGSFWRGMRPSVGFEVGKQVSPALGLAVEGSWGINTSTRPGAFHSHTAFDNSYIGALGQLDFMRLFNPLYGRRFSVSAIAGAGWGHLYRSGAMSDHNYFATRAGLALDYRFTRRMLLSLRPSFVWDMSDADINRTSAGYKASRAVFSLQAVLKYDFGPGFQPMPIYDMSIVDNLNAEINRLRSSLDECHAQLDAVRSDLEESRSVDRPVVREVVVNNQMNTIYDVFFHTGSSVISVDQLANVERVAAHLRNNPDATVTIKGYTSSEGSVTVNARLSTARAQAVKTALVNRYHIDPDRITAEGCGVGKLFDEESWNRVSVCSITIK